MASGCSGGGEWPTVAVRGARSFILVALASVIVLSIAWSWIGKGYIALMIDAVSPLVGANVTVDRQGHEILVFVRSQSEPTVSLGVTINGKQLTYGLIPGVALLLAIPGIAPRTRVLLLIVTVLVGFVATSAGLHLLIQRQVSLVQERGAPDDLMSFSRTVSFLMPQVPSVVWVPVVYMSWRKRLSAASQ